MPNYSLKYGVAEVARILKVDRDLIKMWAYKFVDHLSKGANPPKDLVRQFTSDDIYVFGYISMYWEEHPDMESIEIGLNNNNHKDYPYSDLASSVIPIFREFTDDYMDSGIPMIGGMLNCLDNFTLAESYHFAGDALIDSALEKNEESALLYPIIFNYRHAVELYLKAISLSKKRTHDLLQLYEKFKVILKEEFETIPPDWFDNIMLAFNDFDPEGQVFRYGENIYKNEMLVDLRHLKMMMGWLSESFQRIKERQQGLINKMRCNNKM